MDKGGLEKKGQKGQLMQIWSSLCLQGQTVATVSDIMSGDGGHGHGRNVGHGSWMHVVSPQ